MFEFQNHNAQKTTTFYRILSSNCQIIGDILLFKNNIVLNITLHTQIWTQLDEIYENVTFLLL